MGKRKYNKGYKEKKHNEGKINKKCRHTQKQYVKGERRRYYYDGTRGWMARCDGQTTGKEAAR